MLTTLSGALAKKQCGRGVVRDETVGERKILPGPGERGGCEGAYFTAFDWQRRVLVLQLHVERQRGRRSVGILPEDLSLAFLRVSGFNPCGY